MSDEFRDLLKHRADDVHVPAGDLGDVISGGNARRWRNRAYSVGVVVLVAVVGWATVPGIVDSLRGDDAPKIANTPTPSPTPTLEAGTCETVPFRPTYLPDGWSYELRPGTGLQAGIPLDEQVPSGLGYYTLPEAKPTGTHFNIMKLGSYYILDGRGEPIDVLGEEGRIGRVEDGFTVEVTYDGCDYSLMSFGISQPELRQIIAGLESFDCEPPEVNGRITNLGDGRHFGYIKAIDPLAVELDVAEWLSGDAANEAAIAAGDIEEGETVPNDYYIVNDDKATTRFSLSNSLKVTIDTIQDSVPGPAPADLAWLICEFSGEKPENRVTHRDNGYWLTVKDGVVTEIEEQYVP